MLLLGGQIQRSVRNVSKMNSRVPKMTHLEIGLQTHKMRDSEINWHKNGSDPLIV
jgi:hypothetical protein